MDGGQGFENFLLQDLGLNSTIVEALLDSTLNFSQVSVSGRLLWSSNGRLQLLADKYTKVCNTPEQARIEEELSVGTDYVGRKVLARAFCKGDYAWPRTVRGTGRWSDRDSLLLCWFS